MPKKQIVSIDIDDVIADSTESLRLLVNQRTGATLSQEDYYSTGGEYWGYYDRVWRRHGIHDLICYKDLCAEMEVDQSHVSLLSGAKQAIDKLSERYHVVLITARDASWEVATREWLSKQFGSRDIEIYFCESHKNAQEKTKGQLCHEMDAIIHIDDNVLHCQSVLDEEINSILFGNYGWQSHVPDGAVRCKDWVSVLNHISTLQSCEERL